jgi:hypothetical protein
MCFSPDGSFQEWFGSRFGRERALHRPYRSLDRLDRLRFISCFVACLVRPLWRLRPSLVCWLGAIFSVNKPISLLSPRAILIYHQIFSDYMTNNFIFTARLHMLASCYLQI